MAYYLSPSLAQLKAELNAAHPNRDRSSDGWIGDKAHAARKSDHNPDWSSGGVVRAVDIDKDGIDVAKLIHVALSDPRTEYVIFQGSIYLRSNNFKRQKYTGSNSHNGHIHISQRSTKAAEKSTVWGYSGTSAPVPSVSGGGRTLAEVAGEVIAGRWGNGSDRANRLTKAGYNPSQVQAEVNRQVKGGGSPSAAAKKSNAQVAAEVVAGQWGNGADRANRLARAGYNAAQIQAEVNRQVGGGAAAAPARKSNDQLAAEVIAGQWGNGAERNRRLGAAGYNASQVQAAVNAKVSGSRPAVVRPDNTTLARQVINGQWGNGNERNRRLTAAGYNYAAIRAEVNRLLR